MTSSIEFLTECSHAAQQNGYGGFLMLYFLQGMHDIGILSFYVHIVHVNASIQHYNFICTRLTQLPQQHKRYCMRYHGIPPFSQHQQQTNDTLFFQYKQHLLINH